MIGLGHSRAITLYIVRSLAAASFFVLAVGLPAAQAQNFAYDLFGRYVDSVRQQAGIPGMSVKVIQNGAEWDSGFGFQDVDGRVPATPDTPYYIGDISQTLGAALLVRKCYEQDTLELGDLVTRWVPDYPDGNATVGHLLTHTTNAGSFQYSLDRFAGLTDVIVECADLPYRHVLYNEVFNRFGMGGSVPGTSYTGTSSPGNAQFDPAVVARFDEVTRRAALTYKLDRGRVVRSDIAPPSLTTGTGVLSTVRDLARFDIALGSGAIIASPSLTASWTQAVSQGSALPTGLGWFVQNLRGEPLIWQFGLIRDGHSALMLKLPQRGLTFIALANSDAMTAGYNLENGDVRTSPFAKLFLDFFVPVNP
jgi:CubicO group peptidase (beta-lactamase class C family)